MNTSLRLPASQLTGEARQRRIDQLAAEVPSAEAMAAYRSKLAAAVADHFEELALIPYPPRKGR